MHIGESHFQWSYVSIPSIFNGTTDIHEEEKCPTDVARVAREYESHTILKYWIVCSQDDV